MNRDNLRGPRPIDHVLKQEKKRQQNAEKANQDRSGDPSDLGSSVSIPDNYNGRPKNNNPKHDPQILMPSSTAKRIANNEILDNLKASQKVNTDDFCRPTTIASVPKRPKQVQKSNLDVFGQHNAEEANQNRVVGSGELGSIESIPDNYNGRPENSNPKFNPQILMSSRTAKRITNNAILDNLKASQKVNTDDFCKRTTVFPVPKQARKSNLDVFKQHNNAEQEDQNCINDPGDLGSTVSISGNYNGRPKDNGSKYDAEKLMPKRAEKNITNNAKVDNLIVNQKVNTDSFHTPMTIDPVPKQIRKNNNNLDVFGQRNAEQANQNRIGDPIDFASTAWIPDKHNGRPKSNGQKYDLDLLMRTRVIRSGDVRKSTLIKRDETAKEFSAEKTDEDDETFFAKLKKRIIEDLQKNISNKAPDTSPKRLSKPRKIKSLFDNETRGLMNKFREEFALNQSKKILSEENGVFSMERRSSICTREDVSEQPHLAMPQNVVQRGMTKNIPKKHFETADDSIRDRSPFKAINAEAYKDQSIPSSSENTRMFTMKRRSNTWTRENIRDTHPAMSQNVAERRMTKNISKKHFEPDDDSVRDRSPFNEIHAEAYNNQPIPENTRMFPMKRRSNTWTRENIREHTHPAMSQNVVERTMTKNIPMKLFENDEELLRDRSPFNRINAEDYNDQPTPSSSKRSRMFSVKHRSNSWTREDIREHTQPAMSQNVAERTMTKDIPMKLFETDEESLRDRSPFNRINAEDYNDQPTPSPPERNGMFSMKRRSNSWTREDIREHTHPAMSQNVVERTMTKDIPMKLFETDEDSLRDRSPFNRINAEDYNDLPTPSPPERNGTFSMKLQGNSWTREDFSELAHSAMPQNVVKPRMMNDVMWESCEIHDEDYYRLPTPSSSVRNDVFSLERRNNGSTRENICEHRQPAMPQYVVEHRMTNDSSKKYPQTDENLVRDRSPSDEIHAEAYSRQPVLLSSGYPLGDYPTIQYYQIMQ